MGKKQSEVMSYLSITPSIRHIHTEHWFEVVVEYYGTKYLLTVKANWVNGKYHIGSCRFSQRPIDLNKIEKQHIQAIAEDVVKTRLNNVNSYL